MASPLTIVAFRFVSLRVVRLHFIVVVVVTVVVVVVVKGPERAGVKVRTRYGGDASQLSDVVRATLMFTIRPNVLTDMYAVLSSKSIARLSNAFFTLDLMLPKTTRDYSCESTAVK